MTLSPASVLELKRASFALEAFALRTPVQEWGLKQTEAYESKFAIDRIVAIATNQQREES